MPETTVDALVERYPAFLVDAYGVLVDAGGALPGARALIERLEAAGRTWLVVTNDASRSPSACAARYRHLGIPIPEDRVLTSGSLVAPHLRARGLEGRRALVLGPPDSHAYVRQAGVEPVGPECAEGDLEALVIGDEAGFDALPGLDAALSLAYARRERGERLELVLPNPDLVFPKGPGTFGFAAGSLAGMIERALELRYPDAPENRFVRLGKPHAAIFEAALARLGSREAVMIGDQPATDVAGALGVGIDAALLTSGVGRLAPGAARPTWLLSHL